MFLEHLSLHITFCFKIFWRFWIIENISLMVVYCMYCLSVTVMCGIDKTTWNIHLTSNFLILVISYTIINTIIQFSPNPLWLSSISGKAISRFSWSWCYLPLIHHWFQSYPSFCSRDETVYRRRTKSSPTPVCTHSPKGRWHTGGNLFSSDHQ